MNKVAYEAPEMEIMQFETEDIIRTSSKFDSEPDFDATAPDFEWGDWP